MHRVSVLVVALGAFVACEPETIGSTVEPVPSLWATDTEGPGAALRVVDDDGYSFVSGGSLIGFRFEWGVEQHIITRLADGDDDVWCARFNSGMCRIVLEVDRRTVLPAGDKFYMRIPAHPPETAWFRRDDAGLMLLGTRIDVLTPELATSMEARDAALTEFTMEFEHTDDPDVPIRALQILSRAP